MVEQVGPVYLNGLTIGEANAKLREVFGQIYAGVSGDSPASEVRVTLGRLRTIQVNVMGEVETPGTYRLSSFSTVFHALYRAGGVTPIGGLRDIGVMRGAVKWRAGRVRLPAGGSSGRRRASGRGRRGDRAPLRAAGQRLGEGEASDALRDETRRDAGSSAGLRGRLHGGTPTRRSSG